MIARRELSPLQRRYRRLRLVARVMLRLMPQMARRLWTRLQVRLRAVFRGWGREGSA
jgi:hypothetical protein